MATPDKRLDALERATTPRQTAVHVLYGDAPDVREEARRLTHAGVPVLHVTFSDEGDQRPAA